MSFFNRRKPSPQPQPYQPSIPREQPPLACDICGAEYLVDEPRAWMMDSRSRCDRCSNGVLRVTDHQLALLSCEAERGQVLLEHWLWVERAERAATMVGLEYAYRRLPAYTDGLHTAARRGMYPKLPDGEE